FRISTIESNIEDIQTQLEILQTIGTQLSLLQNDLENTEKRISDQESRLLSIETSLRATAAKVISPTQDTIEKIILLNVDSGVADQSVATWAENDVFGIDEESGEEYTVEELYNEKLLIPYTYEEEEILFYGQFNEKGHWDSDCLINVYVDNELILIMEALYDDGNLLSYQQVLSETTDADVDLWIVSDREHDSETGSNEGNSWNYFKEADFQQSFELTEAQYTDLVSVENFVSSGGTGQIEGFYHGTTFEGKYNDDTGTAYLVKYDSAGKVRLLYEGCFKDGVFNDNTGDAWYITRDEGTDYMYFCGVFRSGNVVKTGTYSFENNLTQERIAEIIGDREFECELDWYFPSEYLY
ncbi:MAG: hypothetical protein LUE98_07540, partial [Tannerellaceae bacterium]|nr:hypothetical protein [Tannerellaceae bacterium]